MVKHAEFARPLLLGCALWSLSLAAAAQDKQQENQPAAQQNSERGFFLLQDAAVTNPSAEPAESEKPNRPAVNPFNSANVLRSEDASKLRQQFEARQAQLRAQLADPKQRAQVMGERIEQQRSTNRDLPALLRLDPRTADRLFAVLADLQLSQELAGYPSRAFARADKTANGKPYDPMRSAAQRYTQRMAEIGKIIGATRLDDYVDYERKAGDRTMVDQFDQLLPADSKLTFEQRNSLAELFHQQAQSIFVDSRMLGRSSPSDLTLSEPERNRRMRVRNLALNERSATLQEAANREVVDRAASILTPEQTKTLTRWKQQQLDQRRAWAQAQRRVLGIDAEAELDLTDQEILPSPPISKNLRLSIDLTVNDTQVVKELTSVRGGTVSLEAEGLLVEVRPYMEQERLLAELKIYERVRGGRRLLGQMGGSAALIEAGKPSLFGGGGGTIVQGRKGYAINWSVSGKYL